METNDNMTVIEGDYNEVDWFGEVRVNGTPLDPAESLKVFNHSPDGFAWGYYGSGPAQLALAILLHHGLSAEKAVFLHQRFKTMFIGRLPRASFRIEVNIPAFIEEHMRTTAMPSPVAE